MVEVDESMMAAAPKMASATAFIQEEAPDCSAATSKAYEKFEGDMAKITALKEKADGRANKAETEAQKQGGIARRCLAAEQLLSGDAKARREKLRAHIKKEVSIVEQQYAAKAKQLAEQCSDKIAMARKDEAAKSGSEVDSTVKAEQLRMKKEVDQFAAQKAAFKLKGQRMKLRLKVELDNVQNKVTEAKKKQMAAEEGLKKAERTIARLEEKMKREAVLAKQKLDAVKGQLAAKTNRNDKVALAKEKAALHEALSKDKRAESALEKEKNAAKLASDKAADKEKALADKVSRLRGEKNAEAKKAQAEEIALAGAKSKAVAQQAKDAIAEGQTKGQLTVVLGKLKGDKAT